MSDPNDLIGHTDGIDDDRVFENDDGIVDDVEDGGVGAVEPSNLEVPPIASRLVKKTCHQRIQLYLCLCRG